jgi:hypothetical protein
MWSHESHAVELGQIIARRAAIVNRQLHDGLCQIADVIDPDRVRSAERIQKAAWCRKPVDRIPVIIHGVEPPDWPRYPQTEEFLDPEKMLWNQLVTARTAASVRDDRMMCIRANYGPGIIPSMLGATVQVDDTTTWTEPCHGSCAIREMIDRGVPDLLQGYGSKVLQTEAFFRDILCEYGLAPYVHVYQCNNQGIFDIAYLLWGQEIYFAMYDEPELVHGLLDLITRTTIALVRAQKEILGEPNDEMYHMFYWVPGGVRVVDDVTMNLSPDTYDEFCRPYNERLFAAFGGGYIHY